MACTGIAALVIRQRSKRQCGNSQCKGHPFDDPLDIEKITCRFLRVPGGLFAWTGPETDQHLFFQRKEGIRLRKKTFPTSNRRRLVCCREIFRWAASSMPGTKVVRITDCSSEMGLSRAT
jgi:hypothetical protein